MSETIIHALANFPPFSSFKMSAFHNFKNSTFSSLERHIWWKDFASTSPEELAARIMVMGTWQDILTCEKLLGKDIFNKVLNAPPRGLFDPKSWIFWHKKTGRLPVPPLPEQPAPWPLR